MNVFIKAMSSLNLIPHSQNTSHNCMSKPQSSMVVHLPHPGVRLLIKRLTVKPCSRYRAC